MISSMSVRVPKSLYNKLNRSAWQNVIKEFVNNVGVDALSKVQEYGIGTSGGVAPEGGAPHWQGPITVRGHYSGYLSDEHHINKIDDYHLQIVTTADFAEGVIYGYSTNWVDNGGAPFLFEPNPYHKRAVDNMVRDGMIANRWHEMGSRVK